MGRQRPGERFGRDVAAARVLYAGGVLHFHSMPPPYRSLNSERLVCYNQLLLILFNKFALPVSGRVSGDEPPAVVVRYIFHGIEKYGV